MASQPSVPEVVQVDPARTAEAMSALLSAGPAVAARSVEQAKRADISLDLMWCVTDDVGRYRLAVLAVLSPGRTCMLVATRARDERDVVQLGRAIAAAGDGCAARCDLAQALVDPTFALDIKSYEAGGLRRMAVLDYLERALPRSGTLPSPEIPAGWSIEPAAARDALDGDDPTKLDEACRGDLIRALEDSYIDTKDCPGLAGLRSTADVLDGHFGTGARRRLWTIARENGQVRGVCLLNLAPEGTTAELVYFGLSPAARGRGLARVMLAAGMHACSTQRVASIMLAVDAQNLAAKRLYEDAGFRKTSARVALVRALRR